MLKAVIFDMDGTLFDTEAIYAQGWYKGGVPHELYLQMIGTSVVNERRLLSSHGFDADAVINGMYAYAAEELAKEVPLKPGVREALKWIKQRGFRTAVATSSPKERAEKNILKTGLADSFDAVVSGFSLVHGKPYPDIFLIAAEELGISPEDCLVVEDAPNGIRAGKAAGMASVMIPDLVQPDEEVRALADGMLTTLHELPDWIEQNCQF